MEKNENFHLDKSIVVPKSISVDIDGCLLTSDKYPEVDIEDFDAVLIGYLQMWQEQGGVVLINSARRRSNGTMQPVLEALELGFGFHPDYVNENIKEGIEKFGDCRKIVADYYLDDRNVTKQEFYSLVTDGVVGYTLAESKFRYLTDELAMVLQKKNIAYGNSFDKEIDEWGLSALCIRLSDKYGRIKNLIQDPNIDYGDESLYDTLKDLAGYAILGMYYLNEQKGKARVLERKDGKN